MTYLEVGYRYTGPLGPAQMERMGELPGTYGIRRIRLDETNCLVQIEYDASRLTETEVVHCFRRAGIPLTEKVDANSLRG
ncbi:MAG: hypothetical protein ACE5HL_03955 [Terriglobia bacterium]